jgi:hypothetical protein
MKIRFRIDKADLFRRGFDARASVVSLEVNPSTLPEGQRELIAKHLLDDETDDASDACNVIYDPEQAKQLFEVVPVGGHRGADLIEAKNQTLDSLVEALERMESQANLSAKATVF